MKLLGFQLYKIPKLGNCLFETFSHQVYGHIEAHLEMRAEAMKYIKEHHNYFLYSLGKFPNVEAYCKHYGKPTVYGGYNEIIALCKVYKIEFVLHQTDVKPYSEQINGPQQHSNVVRLCYHKDQKHYNSIVKIIPEISKSNEKAEDLLETDSNPI